MANEETAAQLSKYFGASVIMEVMRSQIHPSDYNPRKIDDIGKKTLKKSLKLYGVLGGIIVNKQTQGEIDGVQHYTIVGGHQKVYILDEMNKYDDGTYENDYVLRVEVIDVDLKTEKQINVILNNANAQGQWDWDKLRELIPDIDYKDAGLSEADLSMIGVDYLFKTEAENQIQSDLENMMRPADEAHEAEMERRRAEREAIRDAQAEARAQQELLDSTEMDEDARERAEAEERQRRIDHMKDVKNQVKEDAIRNAKDSEAYIMLSFDNWDSKVEFCDTFSIDPYQKFIKGEVFRELLENGGDESLNFDEDE